MSDFSKIHGPGYAATNAEFLRTENSQLKQRIGQLEQVLGQRSVAALAEIVDGLNLAVSAANQGDEGSKALVGNLLKALENARAALSKLTVVRT